MSAARGPVAGAPVARSCQVHVKPRALASAAQDSTVASTAEGHLTLRGLFDRRSPAACRLAGTTLKQCATIYASVLAAIAEPKLALAS